MHTNRFERRKQRTRDALKQAAVDLILKNGYDAVSVQDITDHADLGRGTLYVHFPGGKEEIVWHIIREGFDAAQADIAGRLAAEVSPRLEYLTWTRWFERAAEQRDLFLVALGGKGSMLLYGRALDYLADNLIQEMENGRFFPGSAVPPPLMAQFVAGGLARALVWWLQTPNPYSAGEMAGQLFRCVFHAGPPVIQSK